MYSEYWPAEGDLRLYAEENVNIVLIANEFCGHCAGCSVSKCLFRKDCYDLHSLDYTEKELREEDGYPFTECIESRDNPDTPQTWLKMSFIRPEDIFMYEGIGINTFKITGRTTGMDTFRRIVSAYCKGRYDGNLLDLCSPKKTILKNGTVFQDRKPYIENERLNGFVDYWFQNPDHRCAEHECGITCDYCDRFYRERFL